MPSSNRHLMMYGLHIQSELPLHEHRPAPDETGPADVVISMGSSMASTEDPPAGRVLLDFAPGRRFYCATEAPDGGYVLRCHRVADFVIDANLRAVTVRPVATTDLEYASVLATGTLLSFLLSLRGHTVLHASAVQVGNQALAFVGASGMGKSTMAALVCAEGGELITDDVLRLDSDDAPLTFRCRLGATELRLRKAAGDLAGRFAEDVDRRRTVDDRHVLGLTGSVQDHLPLAGIVIPMPDHDRACVQPEITRLDPMKALLTLVRFPRILGWQDTATMNEHFNQLAEVAQRVPIYTARMPWGPPFPDGIGRQMLDEIGLDGLTGRNGPSRLTAASDLPDVQSVSLDPR